MGAGRVLCDDVLRRRMRTCVLSVSSTVSRSIGWSVDPGTMSQHFGAETKSSCLSGRHNYVTVYMKRDHFTQDKIFELLVRGCSP